MLIKLIGSVGEGGDNQPVDVKLMQWLLNFYFINLHAEMNVRGPLSEDGIAGKQTIERIKIFQSRVLQMNPPTGCIEPASRTFQALADIRRGASAVSGLNISADALNLLKQHEEFRAQPYYDGSGKTITAWQEGATIGYGHLIAQNEWEKYANGITQQQATALFTKDLGVEAVAPVKKNIKIELKQNEFDALVILVFNIGQGAFQGSSALQLLNNPSAKTAFPNLEKAWKAFNKSRGQISNGLVRRRDSEWKIFSQAIYERL